MRVLWVVSAPVYKPESKKSNSVREGWIQGALKVMTDNTSIEFIIVYPQKRTSPCDEYIDAGVQYCGFYADVNTVVYERKSEKQLYEIFQRYFPDIIHIWGTERIYSLAAVNAAESLGVLEHVVISIQGLCSVLANNFTTGIPERYRKGFSIPELGKRTSLNCQSREFALRGRYERESIVKVRHVIGRTEWDRIFTYQIHAEARYYHCNEIIREGFYRSGKWKLKNCQKNLIFFGQGLTPCKGMHILLKALPLVKKEYPNVLVVSTGIPGKNKYTKYPIRKSYERYLFRLIKENQLEENVEFIGILDEQQMIDAFLKAHVYVNSSSIENESNALSEAKLLGVPSIASYEGGVIDRIDHGEDGFFYPFNEPNILAEHICRIFRDDALAEYISHNAIRNAEKVNNRTKNGEVLLGIYERIGERQT